MMIVRGKAESAQQPVTLPNPGASINIRAVGYRLLAYVGGRALLTGVMNHHPWLEQDEDGSLQLPKDTRLLDMLRSGEARLAKRVEPAFTHTEKLKFTIDLLDANRVRQGEKAIWLFLAEAWTPDLLDRFGPYDDPWRIRRWRADLRKAAKKQLPDAHSSVITER